MLRLLHAKAAVECAVLAGIIAAACPLEGQQSDSASTVDGNVLRVASFDFEPFHVVSPSGDPRGFAIDVIEAVARRAGMEIRYVSMPSSQAAQAALAEGVVDVLPSMGLIASRDARMDFSVPVHSTQIRIFVKSGRSSIHGLEDLGGRRVAVVERNVGLDIVASLSGVSVTVYDDNADALLALMAGHVDAMIYPESMFWALATELGVRALVKSTGDPLRDVTRGLAVREGNDVLLSRLNPAIDALLADQEYSDIAGRWFPEPPPFWTVRRILAWAGILLLVVVGGYTLRVRYLNRRLVRSQEQLRALASHLQSVREDERTTLARELHDEIAQAMTVLKMELDFLRGPDLTGDRVGERVDVMVTLTDKAISAGHRICTRLRPGLLDDLGLAAAVDWVAEDFEARTGVPCELEVVGSDTTIDPDLCTALFRILQEALVNVVRHADAQSVAIRLDLRGDPLRMEVVDDGRGVSREALDRPTSLGILGMRERAATFGGMVTIGRRAGGGTVLRVCIPGSGVCA